MALVCPECGTPIDPAGPGVSGGRQGSHPDSPATTAVWVPFIEDLRGGPTRLMHPRCYARIAGFDALLEAIARYDNDSRMQLFDLIQRNEELRRYCLDLKAGLQRGDAPAPPVFPTR